VLEATRYWLFSNLRSSAQKPVDMATATPDAAPDIVPGSDHSAKSLYAVLIDRDSFSRVVSLKIAVIAEIRPFRSVMVSG
jgi:hypothetical protein